MCATHNKKSIEIAYSVLNNHTQQHQLQFSQLMGMSNQLTDSLARQVGFRLAEGNGCPTLLGLVVHALVFALISDLLYATLFVGLDM